MLHIYAWGETGLTKYCHPARTDRHHAIHGRTLQAPAGLMPEDAH